MPEIKNTFLKSKMNKDLDARLLPNGEYRDGQNISISKSEGSDVGALENIRGNILVTDFGLTNTSLEIIGIHSDVKNNRIFCFITNFSDSSGGENINLHANDFINAECYIAMYEVNNNSYTILVSGRFLNLSKTHRVYNVNILEDLLFWTDNRNQPRKINIGVAMANTSYYNSEDLISVLKYNPYNSIKFVENTTYDYTTSSSSDTSYTSTLINETDEFLTPHLSIPADVSRGSTGTHFLDFNSGSSFNSVSSSFDLSEYLPAFNTTTRQPKIRVTNDTRKGSGEYIVFNYSLSGNWTVAIATKEDPYTRVDLPSSWESGDVYSFSLENPYYNPSFRGDEKYLEDKFVRFSYRFKYLDSEYSLMAPFTQPAFIPKQYGSFLEGDEDRTKESTIVDFFENQVTSVGLTIDLPYDYNQLYDKLGIDKIDILLKESENNNVYVVETIDREDFQNYIGGSLRGNLTTKGGIPISATNSIIVNNAGADGIYRPIVVTSGNGKKLILEVEISAGQIIRITVLSSGTGFQVGDTITIPAGELSQNSSVPSDPVNIPVEIDFLNAALDNQFLYYYKSQKPYKVIEESEIIRVSDKAPIRAFSQEATGNRVMYGNFIDRQDAPEKLDYSISVGKKFSNTTSVKEYPVHNLKQNRTYQVGVVLLDRYGRSSNVLLNDNIFNSTATGVKESSIFNPYNNSGIYFEQYWPGDNLKVSFNSIIPEDNIYSLSNPTGWYSYKIVVKQTEQEYYNVYVPGTLSGKINWNPDASADWTSSPTVAKTRPFFNNLYSTANIPLFSDNINKVPRNLNEVGPEQTDYLSDTLLYNRVNPNAGSYTVNIYNTQTSSSDAISKIEISSIKQHRELGDWATTKGQFYPGQLEDNTASSNIKVEPWYPFVWGYGTSSPYPLPTTSGSQGVLFEDLFLKAGENPYIATLSSDYRLGTTPGYNFVDVSGKYTRGISSTYDSVAIYETNPTVSKLEVLWETSTSGLISDINKEIRDSVAGAQSRLSSFNFILNEVNPTGTVAIDNPFAAVDVSGNLATDEFATMQLIDVVDDTNTSRINDFNLIQYTAGSPGQSPTWNITSNREFAYLGSNFLNRRFRFKLRSTVFNQLTDYTYPDLSLAPAQLQNTKPFITPESGGSSQRPVKSIRTNLTDFWEENTIGSNGGPGSISSRNGEVASNAVAKTAFEIVDFRNFDISNGSIVTALKKDELKINIVSIRRRTFESGVTPPNIINEYNLDNFIVDSTGYRIISNPNSPPRFGATRVQPFVYPNQWSATGYVISYTLDENWSGGLSSDEYELIVQVYSRANQN